MNPKEKSAQLGSSWQDPIVADDQNSRGDSQPKEDISSVKPQAASSEQPSQASQDPDTDTDTVDVTYKIVCSDRYEYSLGGKVYFRYLVPPEKRSTSWFCIVAFHWLDVRAEFECVYHPSIKLFEDFKPVESTFKGGSNGVQRVELSMWNFADRGADLNPKHTVYDDNGNRILLAILIKGTRLAVKLYGKMLREEDKDKEDAVWLSEGERKRLGLDT